MKRAIVYACLFILLSITACKSTPQEPERVVEVTVEVPIEVPVGVTTEVTRIVPEVSKIEVTRPVEVTRIVERTVVATPTIPPIPYAFVEISGNGSIVTDNYSWGGCQKAVFYWTANGRDNIIIHLHRVGSDDLDVLLVNEIGPDEGQTLQPFTSGTYYFSVDGPSEGWTIRGECQDPGITVNNSSQTATLGTEEYLSSLLPSSDQWPLGMQFSTSRTTTNQDIANNADDPVQRLQELEAYGRQLGYAEAYVDEGFCDTRSGLYRAYIQVVIYAQAQGAKSQFDAAAEDYSGYTDTTFQYLDLGDQAFWYRWTGPGTEVFTLDCDPPTEDTLLLLIFTKNNIFSVVSLRGVDVTESELLDQAVELALTVEGKI